VRIFLAINLPPGERRAIRGATAPMREAARGISWVDEDNLHLTMKFFGEQPEEAVPPLRDALAGAVRDADAPELALGGLGAFPNLRAPRVVWLGVGADPRLELLHHDVERACAALGYEVEGRAFRPHVTLGRVRERLSGEAARALAAAAREVRYASTVRARSLDLMASRLGAQGARYTVLAAIPLGGA
jgi:RNA 2',3'-cyclic 3'-phosphodiesterase